MKLRTVSLLANFIWLIPTVCDAADPIALTVPPLLTEQPLIESISRVGDEIVVSTESYGPIRGKPSSPYWLLSSEASGFIPYRSQKGESVVAVANSVLSPLIVVADGSSIGLRFLRQPERNVTVPESPANRLRLTANQEFTFLIFPGKIMAVASNGAINRGTLDHLVPKNLSHLLPSALVATDTELILGYDHGEWGGAAYALKIMADGSVNTPRLLVQENVRALRLDQSGGVWIACGLAHLSMQAAGLHYYDGNSVNTIISQESFSGKKRVAKSHTALSLPLPTAINGMTINSKGEVVIVATEAGLLALAPDSTLRHLWKGSLRIHYTMPGFSVGSYPQGIVEHGNSLYVASRSLGVIRFEAITNGQYVPVEQICFK